MFASLSTDVGSQLLLWGAQGDYVAGVDSLVTGFGGWTTGAAKQYSLGKALVSILRLQADHL